MSAADWFKRFSENIQIKNTDSISHRYQAITQRLNADFWNTNSKTAHSFYVGSYGRNTAIHSLSDLDMIFELPKIVYDKYNQYTSNGQSALLQSIRSSMQKTYSYSAIGADGQVVAVSFNDRIKFEVVPVFTLTSGGYYFPDANDGGKWRITNPKAEIAAIRERNKVCNNNLILLSRMMRAWKENWNVPISGILIDTFVYQFIESHSYREKSYFYHDLLCRDFFKWMSDQNEAQEYWKAPGSGRQMYGKGLFQYKAKRCYNISLEAIAYGEAYSAKEYSAKQKWREIFGTAFPN
jgi:hypothetical protein